MTTAPVNPQALAEPAPTPMDVVKEVIRVSRSGADTVAFLVDLQRIARMAKAVDASALRRSTEPASPAAGEEAGLVELADNLAKVAFESGYKIREGIWQDDEDRLAAYDKRDAALAELKAAIAAQIDALKRRCGEMQSSLADIVEFCTGEAASKGEVPLAFGIGLYSRIGEARSLLQKDRQDA